MRVGIHPFYSQQDKATGTFLLSSCAAYKFCSWIKSRIKLDFGWDVRMMTPGAYWEATRRPIPIPNSLQRLHWDVNFLRDFYHDCDIVICNHEYMAIPLRRLFPRMKLVQQCWTTVDSLLFEEAWSRADLVAAQGDYMARRMLARSVADVTTWKMAYDADLFNRPSPQHRPIDVCFIQRCSASNYTHHEEFLQANRWKTVFTDVTQHLRVRRPDLQYCDHSTYIDTLYASKVAISMHNSWYGGISIREAIAAGCIPVTLDTPAYRELLGDDYPFLLNNAKPETIAYTVDQALSIRNWCPLKPVDSYQQGWPHVAETLRELVR